MSIDDIENFVQRGPLPELYNAIYATVNTSFKVHSTGYVVTLDNNDGSEETSTCRGTTRDRNFTIFQPILHGKYI